VPLGERGLELALTLAWVSSLQSLAELIRFAASEILLDGLFEGGCSSTVDSVRQGTGSEVYLCIDKAPYEKKTLTFCHLEQTVANINNSESNLA